MSLLLFGNLHLPQHVEEALHRVHGGRSDNTHAIRFARMETTRSSSDDLLDAASGDNRAGMEHIVKTPSQRPDDRHEDASDWRGAFANRNASDFAGAFSEDVVLEASLLNRPIIGKALAASALEAASKIYESLTFTSEATAGRKTYVEWEASAFGGVAMRGVTVIARNEAGLITHLAIHHRPLPALLQMSATLGSRLSAIIDPTQFLAAEELDAVKARVRSE